jgi:hypothetical protein
MKNTPLLLSIVSLFVLISCDAQTNTAGQTGEFVFYPEVNDKRPDLPSPFISDEGEEYITAVTKEGKYAIIRATPGNDWGICKQLIVDTLDFPALAETGLHSEERLNNLQTITGWSLDTITELGRPGRLSQGGFMAENETILSVLQGDNELVSRMGLTHPQMARPLFHVLNMMDTDLALERWNMAIHQWDHIRSFFYNGQHVQIEAHDTKGGQQSIFNDGIQGAFFMIIWRDLSQEERQFLQERYGHLSPEQMEELITRLSKFTTGEMQPQYIMRYGFYEGHTFWRVDPVAMAFIFGFKSLEELDGIFEGRLDEVLVSTGC